MGTTPSASLTLRCCRSCATMQMCGLPWDVVREARAIKNDLVTRIAPGASIVTGATLVGSGAVGGAAGTGGASATGSSIAVTPSKRGGTGGGVVASAAGGDGSGTSSFELQSSSSTSDALLHAKRFKMMTEAAAQLSALTLSPMHEMDMAAVRSLVQGVRDAFATTFLDVGVTASALTAALDARAAGGTTRPADSSASRTMQASAVAGRPMTAASWVSSGTAGGGGGRIRVSGGVLETSFALSQSQADLSHALAADTSAVPGAIDAAHLRVMDGDVSMIGMAAVRATSPGTSAPDTTLPLRSLPDHDDAAAVSTDAAICADGTSATDSHISSAAPSASDAPLGAALPEEAAVGGPPVDAMGFE